MVKPKTDGAMATPPKPPADDDEPSWFTYEGPKISLAFTLGASKNMTLLGFQASTSISHKQSIAWGTLGLDVNGPLFAELGIKGARDSIKMDLGTALEIAPGGLIHRARARLEAKGLEVESNVTEKDDDATDISTKVTEVENNGAKNETGTNTNANVGHIQT